MPVLRGNGNRPLTEPPPIYLRWGKKMTLDELVEAGILVKVEAPKLPAVRVVGLPWKRAHFFRGVTYGAASTLFHMALHAMGVW